MTPPPLSDKHLDDLRASGLTDATIHAARLRTVSDPAEVARLLNWSSPARSLGPCLAFPFLDRDGKPVGYTRLKPDRPRTVNGKLVKYESPVGFPNRAYIPPPVGTILSDPTKPLLITEGEKKALAATQFGFPCLGLVGVYGWQQKRDRDPEGRATGPRELLPDLAAVAWAGRRVVIVYDSDAATNPNVRRAEWHLAEALAARGAVVAVARLPQEPDGAKNGLDDFLVRHGPEALRATLDDAKPAERPEPRSGKARVVITPSEHEAVTAAAAALARDEGLFTRAGRLVTVTPADDTEDDLIRRSPGTPTIGIVQPAVLRTRLTAVCHFVRVIDTPEGPTEKGLHPPGWLVAGVHALGTWPGVRQLRGITEHPMILADGSILAAPRYDRRSGLYLHLPAGLRLSVPDRPTRKDVVGAVARLDDVVADFPFARPEHKAAYFAGLLTPLARWGYAGPAPLFLIDANVRAAGKGLLATVAGRILIGRELPVSGYTPDAEELRKVITALAIQGEGLVLFDNLCGPVGNGVLDAALTATRWSGRILGQSQTYDGPLDVVFWATGNNVALRADTSRRVAHVRLESPLEKPEERDGFRHPDLLASVTARRGELLSALLTILRAWHVAGRPRHGLRPWGSFEGWSGVVREALVFAGLPDPGLTREELQATADLDAEALRDLLQGIARLDPGGRGLTAADVVSAARGEGCDPDQAADIKAAVEQLAGRLDPKVLGYRLRAFKRRNVGGLMLDQVGSRAGGGVRWTVRPACALSAPAGSVGTIYPSTHAASGPHAKRVDGADDVDVSPQNKIGPGPDCVDGADGVDDPPRSKIGPAPEWGDGALGGDDSPQDESDGRPDHLRPRRQAPRSKVRFRNDDRPDHLRDD